MSVASLRTCLLAFACAVAVLAGSLDPAEAQTSGRIITFGDSLSDNGNLGAAGPPAPYNGNRFTNGIVWTEILSGGSQNSPTRGQPITGNVNFAFGGARTDALPNPTPGSTTTPGIPVQIGQFQGLGGTVGARDTITMWGGANNIFQYFTSTPPASVTQAGLQANSVAAATSMAQNVGQVVGLGGRTFLVANVPDLGATPQFLGGPAQQGASFATAVYNSALGQGLATVAASAPGVNIIQMDTAGLFRAILANPAAFGLTNVTQACITVPSCVGGGAAAQNQFAFWDGVHPTQAGHQLLAALASQLLNQAPNASRAAALGEVAVRNRQTATDDVFDRAGSWARGAYGGQNGAWVTATGAHARYDANGLVPGFSSTMGGGRAGLDREMGNTLVGGSLGVSTGSIGGGLSADVDVIDGDLYAAYLMGPFYVAGQAGVSLNRFSDIRRSVGIGPLVATGNTDALQVSAAAEAGYIMKTGGITLVPSARLQVVNSHINGFTESGDVLAMTFSDRDSNAVIGGIRLRALASLGAFGTGFAEVGYERVLSDSNDGLVAKLANNTALANTIATGDLASRGLSFKVGADTKLTATTHLTVQYGVSLQEGNGVAHTGQARVKIPF
jgi:outer membrane lipase/esterase